MRVAAIELFVPVRPTGRSEGIDDVDAVRSALLRDPQRRKHQALDAIKLAATLKPDVILCPGWTFVGRRPSVATLVRVTGGATLLFEVLGADTGNPTRKANSKANDGSAPVPFVLRGGTLAVLPAQVFAVSDQLRATSASDEVARRIAIAVRTGRNIGHGIVLLCGEVNILRRQVRKGVGVTYGWDRAVDAAGLPATGFKNAVVFNPAHTPNGGYVRAKRRNGPWAAIVSTANNLDRTIIGKRSRLAAPAHAAINGKDLSPIDDYPVGNDGSRVVLFLMP